eukprot:12914996-Prorocentrum_lima.AAC.1
MIDATAGALASDSACIAVPGSTLLHGFATLPWLSINLVLKYAAFPFSGFNFVLECLALLMMS